MKIRIADATGCPAPQFIVEPENDCERAVLKAFLALNNDPKWRFWIHGTTYGNQDGTISAFNFGYTDMFSRPPAKGKTK